MWWWYDDENGDDMMIWWEDGDDNADNFSLHNTLVSLCPSLTKSVGVVFGTDAQSGCIAFESNQKYHKEKLNLLVNLLYKVPLMISNTLNALIEYQI